MVLKAIIEYSLLKEFCDSVKKDKGHFFGKLKSKTKANNGKTKTKQKVDEIKGLFLSKRKKEEIGSKHRSHKRKRKTEGSTQTEHSDGSESGSSADTDESDDSESDDSNSQSSGEDSTKDTKGDN